MKASDYLVNFLIQHNITDVFGYPGGMVTHLMESLDRHRHQITAHVNYHEQASAMAACGWAEVTGLPGVAYATSGPGATNLLTGIACAYFESLPCLFLTGQVNTYEQKDNLRVRQRGFQETDIVAMAKPITKAAMMVRSAAELPEALDYAYRTAMAGRRGPVLLDIPMDVFRSDVPDTPLPGAPQDDFQDCTAMAEEIISILKAGKRPVILAGHGISLSGTTSLFRDLVHITGIPVVTSMIAVDTLPSSCRQNFGMIGAYGCRWANYILDHSDCILTLGSRLDCRQTGVNKALFAPDARILRVDIDEGELDNKAHPDERAYVASLSALLPRLLACAKAETWDVSHWMETCCHCKRLLQDVDAGNPGNLAAKALGRLIPDNTVVTTDVGQNQVWIAQSLGIQEHQRVLFSGGHGAMGYSLPAAIGAAIAAKSPVVCCTGDGGLQMNIQELQFVVRERLPVKIVLFNNHALGMIHHFQEMYFQSNYVQTDASGGYTIPDYAAIAEAYGIRTVSFGDHRGVYDILRDELPALILVDLPETTHVFPKLGMNRPIHCQEPPLSQELANQLEVLFSGLE